MHNWTLPLPRVPKALDGYLLGSECLQFTEGRRRRVNGKDGGTRTMMMVKDEVVSKECLFVCRPQTPAP